MWNGVCQKVLENLPPKLAGILYGQNRWLEGVHFMGEMLEKRLGEKFHGGGRPDDTK